MMSAEAGGVLAVLPGWTDFAKRMECVRLAAAFWNNRVSTKGRASSPILRAVRLLSASSPQCFGSGDTA